MFQVEQDDNSGVLTAEIIIDTGYISMDVYGFDLDKFEDGVVLDIKNNDNYALLSFEHITDVSEVNMAPQVDYTSWEASSTKTVDIQKGLNISGIISRCTITQEKDEILKELI